MKLFLSSIAINKDQQHYFYKLVGKQLSDIRFALLENAADPYDEGTNGFMYDTRNSLMLLGMQLDRIDLKTYQNNSTSLYDLLRTYDVVWCGGGNTYYLRWIMKQSGFDEIIEKLLGEGIIYGGGSAGAIVAGPSLKYVDRVDDPNLSPERIDEGLGLTNIVVVPHWETETYQDALSDMAALYKKDGRTVVPIRDDQAVIVEDGAWKVIPT